MPSHTAASALIKLFSLNGAPWCWTAWQDITGIKYGLFPEEDQHLPPGWTRQNAIDVKSYFTAYMRQPTEEQKIAFAVNSKGVSSFPGREFWNAFVLRTWNSWGVHSIVADELRQHDIHPLNILIRENDIHAAWPTADMYIPVILDSVALRIFGEEAFPEGVEVLTTELRKCLQIICQRSWSSIRQQVGVMKSRHHEIEATALASFEG